jgi:histidine triad (HIT) family protein
MRCCGDGDVNGCVFCGYSGPSPILRDTGDTIIFEPLNPVTAGHVIVVPTAHVDHFTASPALTARVMRRAAEYAEDAGDCNIITSKGPSATQTVEHLHVHVVPRFDGDGLALPWAPAGEIRGSAIVEGDGEEIVIRSGRRHLMTWSQAAQLIVDIQSLASRHGFKLKPLLEERWAKAKAKGLTRRAPR